VISSRQLLKCMTYVATILILALYNDAFDADAQQQFTVVVSKAGSGTGTVKSKPKGINCGNTCSAIVPPGTVGTLIAKPAKDSVFAGWSGDSDCSDGILTIDGSKNCVANFTTFNLTVTTLGSGTVRSKPSGIKCGTACNKNFRPDSIVNLAPKPAKGFVFTGWTDDCAGSSSCNVTMNSNKSVTASFSPANAPPSIPKAEITSEGVVFKTPQGGTTLTIPLANETTSTPSPGGNQVTVIREAAVISDDQRFAGIFTWQSKVTPLGTDDFNASMFRYYDGNGLKWQTEAPTNQAFQNQGTYTDRLISADGNRIALVAAEDGDGAPTIRVFTSNGTVLYSLEPGTFSDYLATLLSPNGQYLLIAGTLVDAGGFYDVVRVVDLDKKIFTDINFDPLNDGPPGYRIGPDGRFVVEVAGIETTLP
jgi:uncharacterized repeat protein (TIGR02543 family)